MAPRASNATKDAAKNAPRRGAKNRSAVSKAKMIEARKIRNRESAERSRRRRVQYTASLEVEVKRLRAENAALKARLSTPSFEDVCAKIVSDENQAGGGYYYQTQQRHASEQSDAGGSSCHTPSSTSEAALLSDLDAFVGELASMEDKAHATTSTHSSLFDTARPSAGGATAFSLLVDSPFLSGSVIGKEMEAVDDEKGASAAALPGAVDKFEGLDVAQLFESVDAGFALVGP
mmetsp:Transcript_68419/g.142671  ORF Transcript_68419/g.142671 Transcript_68419/m.142671 type:complete len:233 (-) Transcript_68419:28-726(-)|eukprot:CAMPEP_0181322928 /NCGR_PEP_ID=MMETSP1101-20121128/19495_1 /TAXON_ID=46948 /ORGANISM="Rhodomonas abbreviata, Strain Caron Lab Isolate" /LENGTH=232 /DNA_ID=CAMNT_0023430885 /DNA_START=168 /DNA_END=866 /DNA_ORIENTATION=-